MKKLVYLVVCLVLGVVHLGCDSSSGSGDAVILSGRLISVEIESSKSGFRFDQEDGWYHQVILEETTAMSVVSIDLGSRDIPDLSFVDSMRQTDTDIADRELGEFYKVRLVREGDRVLMETRQRFMGEYVKESSLEFKGEVEFVEGDWFEYEAGNEVSVRYTADGLEASNNAFVEQVRVALEPTLRSMFLDELKAYKEKEAWEIADSDLGRIVYTEADAEFQLVANTVYHFDQDLMVYDETKPTRMRVFIWFGFTGEHLKGG